MLKIEHLVTCLATVAYVYAAYTVHVTIFSSGSEFRLVSNFTELHTRTCHLFLFTLAIDYKQVIALAHAKNVAVCINNTSQPFLVIN